MSYPNKIHSIQTIFMSEPVFGQYYLPVIIVCELRVNNIIMVINKYSIQVNTISTLATVTTHHRAARVHY